MKQFQFNFKSASDKVGPFFNKQKAAIKWFAAVNDNNLSKIKWLVFRGININYAPMMPVPSALGGYGRIATETALMRAAALNRPQIVDFLIDRKADLNHQDADGYSALMIAVENGNVSIVRKLVKAKAKLNLINIEHETAYLIAKRKRNETIQKILKQSGALTNKTHSSPARIRSGFSFAILAGGYSDWSDADYPGVE